MQGCMCMAFFRINESQLLLPVLQQLHQRLEHQLDTKAEDTEFREKLTQLWDRLHEEYSDREMFLAAHRGRSAGTLKAVRRVF